MCKVTNKLRLDEFFQHPNTLVLHLHKILKCQNYPCWNDVNDLVVFEIENERLNSVICYCYSTHTVWNLSAIVRRRSHFWKFIGGLNGGKASWTCRKCWSTAKNDGEVRFLDFGIFSSIGRSSGWRSPGLEKF